METGISKDGIDAVCSSIQNYQEKINQTLSQIEDIYDEIKTYYEGDTSTEFINKAKELKNNRPIISDNIMSYITDLKKIKTSYEQNDEIQAQNLLKDISKIDEYSWKEGE